MPLRPPSARPLPPLRPLRLFRAPLLRTLLLCALLPAAGCATVGPAASDRAGADPGRELSAAELRAAAVTDGDLGPGYTVTVLKPGHGEAGSGRREVSDQPDCQPLLDAVTPGAGPAAGGDRPHAETDLSVARAADPEGGVYGGLLGYPAGRAEQLHGELDRLLGRCGSFSSTTPGPPGAAAGPAAGAGRKGVRAEHRVTRHDTPTPGGADAVTGFTLTNESGTVTLSQRAVLARVGSVLVVFTTVGVGAERAAEPDERIVRHQVARLRAAQGRAE